MANQIADEWEKALLRVLLETDESLETENYISCTYTLDDDTQHAVDVGIEVRNAPRAIGLTTTADHWTKAEQYIYRKECSFCKQTFVHGDIVFFVMEDTTTSVETHVHCMFTMMLRKGKHAHKFFTEPRQLAFSGLE